MFFRKLTLTILFLSFSVQCGLALSCSTDGYSRWNDDQVRLYFAQARKNNKLQVLVGTYTGCVVTAVRMKSNTAESVCRFTVDENWTGQVFPKLANAESVYEEANAIYELYYWWVDGSFSLTAIFDSYAVPRQRIVLSERPSFESEGFDQRRHRTFAGIRIPIHVYKGFCSVRFDATDRFRRLARQAGFDVPPGPAAKDELPQQ